MKAKIIIVTWLAIVSLTTELTAQNKPATDTKQKTVLLINTHLTYPGWSEGKLNASFYNVAKNFFLSKNYKVLETKVENGYNADDEVEKHLQADIIILQTPVNWENTPWIYKKYVDEVFNSVRLRVKSFFREMGALNLKGSNNMGWAVKCRGKSL